jgi:polyisoprenyl-teichoic acid--peptidoglycan teichoic acid transferase
MADGEKPYRLYKGGRAKGKVPTAPRPERSERASARSVRPAGKPRWGRRIGLAVLGVVVLLVVWTVASFLAFRSGVQEANERLPPTVTAGLAAQDGLLVSKPSLIMLLGTDGDRSDARQDFRRSDSILLVRTDPARNRLAYLSIPRDLRVDIPGFGANKINAAF